MSDEEGALYSEYETFAMVPEWLLDSDATDRAVRLFALLLRYANKGGQAWPSRKTLMERLHVGSTDSVDRAVADLVRVGALEKTRRGGVKGEAWSTSLYTLKRRPSRTPAASPSRTPATRQAAPVPNEREPLNESQTPPAPSEQPPPKVKREPTGKHPLPEDWAPTDALRAWAAETVPLIDIDSVTPIFVAHFLGTGAQHKRWDMSWQRWMRTEQERLARIEARRKPSEDIFAAAEARLTAAEQRMMNEQPALTTGGAT